MNGYPAAEPAAPVAARAANSPAAPAIEVEVLANVAPAPPARPAPGAAPTAVPAPQSNAPTASLQQLVQRQQALLQRLIAMQHQLKAQLNQKTLAEVLADTADESVVGDPAATTDAAKRLQTVTEVQQKRIKAHTERLQQELNRLEAEVSQLADEAAKLAATAAQNLTLTISGDHLVIGDSPKGRFEAKEFRIISPASGAAATFTATPPANVPGQPALARRVVVAVEKSAAKPPAATKPAARATPAEAFLKHLNSAGVSAMRAADAAPPLELAIFKLKHANAESTRAILAEISGIEPGAAPNMQAFGGRFGGTDMAAAHRAAEPSIAVHAATNSIIVRGTPSHIAKMKDLLAGLDAPPGANPPPSPSVRVIRLKHIAAAELVDVLSSLHIRRGIGVDHEANTIIVIDPTQLSNVEQLAKALDVPQKGGTPDQPSPPQPKEPKR